MSRVAIVLVSLVFASSAFLLPSSEAQVVPEHNLSGSVCIASPWYGEGDDCYEAIPGATVHLTGGGMAGIGAVDETQESGDDGQFSFDAIPEGDYTISVERAGFEPFEMEVQVPEEEYVVAHVSGERVDVAGTLIDADGDGVSGAYIYAYGERDGMDAKTDPTGAFTLSVTSGWYSFEIEAPGHAFSGERLLLDGSDIELQLDVLPGQEALIRGQVVDQDGDPVEGVDVLINQWEAYTSDGKYQYGNYRNWTTTDDDGRYEAHVYGGALSMEFRKEGHAQVYEWTELEPTESKTLDVEMMRYPEKTARIIGSVSGSDGASLRYVSISMESPEYGLHECSSSDYDHGAPEPMYAEDTMVASEPYDPYYEPYYQSCAITVNADGSFEGMVTPGYSILRVYYQHWQSCDETHDADGSYRRDCGPDYFQSVQTLSLGGDSETRLDIVLRERPGPDATVSGYVVDGETETALPGAQISFSNQENYAHGSASTDGDGSYKIRLRSGYHEVSVWADGYLPWSGMVYVDAGGDTPFDVILTAGEARYGGYCCYAYEEVAYADGGYDSAESSAPRSSSAGAPAMAEPAPSPEPGQGSDEGYEDLGGGLGPYDPAARKQVLADEASGGAIASPLGFAVAGLIAALVIARRR